MGLFDDLYKALMNPQQILYNVAKESLGTHMTLDNTVPISVGCAEAVSAVLKESGDTGIPTKGIPGTAQLYTYLNDSKLYTRVPAYEKGAVIISPTGSGNGKIRGHTGICGINGIMSNESQTGLWREQWDLTSWMSYYNRYGGLPVYFFRFLGVENPLS